MKEEELISVGIIGGTHGWKGMVKVIPLTDFPQRFEVGQRLWGVRQDGSLDEMLIAELMPYKDHFLMKFHGINSKEEAGKFKNVYLKVSESELYPLPPHHYYHFQLIGLSVFDQERGYLGLLEKIIETGANDVYFIHSPTYGEILIPAIKEVILEVKLHEGEMLIKLLPGLLNQKE